MTIFFCGVAGFKVNIYLSCYNVDKQIMLSLCCKLTSNNVNNSESLFLNKKITPLNLLACNPIDSPKSDLEMSKNSILTTFEQRLTSSLLERKTCQYWRQNSPTKIRITLMFFLILTKGKKKNIYNHNFVIIILHLRALMSSLMSFLEFIKLYIFPGLALVCYKTQHIHW